MNKATVVALLGNKFDVSRSPDPDQETFVCVLGSDDTITFEATFVDDERLLCLVYKDIDDDLSEITQAYSKVTERWLDKVVDHIINVQLRPN